MSKEWKITDRDLDAAFVRVDSIEESIKFENRGVITGCDIFPPTAYPNLTRVVKVRVGNQVAEFENTTLTVVNPKDLVEEAQQQAWDLAKQVYLSKEHGGLSLTEHYEIFGDNCSIGDTYRMPFKEVAAKIEAWEEKKRKQIKIEIGDIVVKKRTPRFYDCDEYLVTNSIGVFIWGISKSGITITMEKADGFVKTGTCPGGIKEFFDEGRCTE